MLTTWIESNNELSRYHSFVKEFFIGLRGAVPLADEQIKVMMRLISASGSKVRNFLDLGCGDGILAAAVLDQHPESKGVLLDFSEPALNSAREKLGKYARNLAFVKSDFSNSAWIGSVAEWAPFDLVMSGFSIHHQNDLRKLELYGEIYDLVGEGGIFLNLDQVSVKTKWVESIWRSYFVDYMYVVNSTEGREKSHEDLAREFDESLGKRASRLTPVEKQCEWLREIGFEDVDCYFKIFESSIFGGRHLKNEK
jgi:tRNA (cmo5U34)-methyltransferase